MQYRSKFLRSIVLVILTFVLIGAGVATLVAQDEVEGQDVTLTGYFVEYISDEQAVFSDGSSLIVVGINTIPRSEILLNEPITIAATVGAEDGKLKVDVTAIEPDTGGASTAPSTPTLPITTVAAIQARPINDQNVILQGQITQSLWEDYFLFSDGTGTIVLEIWNMPARLVPMNELVNVFGEVEVNRLRNEVYIDVKSIESAN